MDPEENDMNATEITERYLGQFGAAWDDPDEAEADSE